MTNRPLLSLVMIVKNESARIRETLLSARAYVDRYTIIDTGSTDGTQEIVRRTMKNMPGALHEEPFVDFATTRNRALELDAQVDGPAVFTLFLSGDEVLCEGRKMREFLETQRETSDDAYNVTIRMDDRAWPYPRVLRTGGKYKYVGKVHEQPLNGEIPHPHDGASVPATYIRHDVSDQEKRLLSMLSVHVPLLEEALNENPKDAWALFYLADTLAHLSEHMPDDVAVTFRMQAMSYLYRRTLIQSGTPDEAEVVRHCLLAYLEIASRAGQHTPQEIFQRIDSFCNQYPDYPEAHLFRLHCKAKVTPRAQMHEMIEAAVASAEVARKNSARKSSLPMNMACEWQSYFIAAQSAAFFCQPDPEATAPDGRKYKDMLDEFARLGIAAGGQELPFRALQGPLKPSDIPVIRGEVPPLEQAEVQS